MAMSPRCQRIGKLECGCLFAERAVPLRVCCCAAVPNSCQCSALWRVGLAGRPDATSQPSQGALGGTAEGHYGLSLSQSAATPPNTKKAKRTGTRQRSVLNSEKKSKAQTTKDNNEKIKTF